MSTMSMPALSMPSLRLSAETLLVVEQVLLIVSATVSFAGCAFIFATWKSFSAPNYLSRRLVASLGLAGLVTAFGFSMSIFVNGIGAHYKQTEALCYLQAFTLQYFYLASYLWTACFAFHLYQIIVKRNEYPEKFLWIYRSIGWGLPGFVLLYLVLRQLTGHLGVGPADRRWCWIAVHEGEGEGSSTADPNAWQREGALQQLLLFYAPIGFVFVFNSAIYYRILRFLSNDPMADRFKKKVVLYLVIFFLCSIWGVINRLVQYFGATHAPSKFLTAMECICDPLQPLLNALAYGTNKQSLEAYKERFCSSWFYASLPSSDDESGVDTTALLSNDEEPEHQEKRFGFDLFHQKRSSSKAKKKKKGVYVSNDDFVDSPR